MAKVPAKPEHCASKIDKSGLSVIADRINSREAEISGLMGRSLHLAALIGADFLCVKKNLPKGDFMSWISANCSVGYHQANRYMRLARECPEYLESANCPVNLSINAALELITSRSEVKELVAEAVAAGEIVHQKVIRELNDKPKRAETWIFTAHVCHHCCGRILRRQVSSKITEFICAKCEKRARGQVDNLCWCGKSVGIHGKIFECIPNPNPRPELLNVIMVREKPVVIKPVSPRPDRRVYCPEY